MIPIGAHKKLQAHMGRTVVTHFLALKEEVMSFTLRHSALLIAPIVFALTACGGGGESDSPAVVSVSTFPLNTVVEHYIKESATYQVRIQGTASANGQVIPLSGTGTYSVSNVPSTFEGAQSIRRNGATTGTIGGNGVSVPVADAHSEHYGLDFKPLGRVALGAYCVHANQVQPPIAAKVGDSGTWYTSTCFTSSSKLSKFGTKVVSYVLEPDSDTTAILKIIEKITPLSGLPALSTSAFRINTAGGYAPLSEVASLTESGVTTSLTLTFQ